MLIIIILRVRPQEELFFTQQGFNGPTEEWEAMQVHLPLLEASPDRQFFFQIKLRNQLSSLVTHGNKYAGRSAALDDLTRRRGAARSPVQENRSGGDVRSPSPAR